MINRMRMIASLSTPLLSCSLFSVFTSKQGILNPFSILYYSTLHSSNQYTLRLSDLDNITNINEAVALFHYMLQMKPRPSICSYSRLFRGILRMEHYSEVIFMFKEMCLLGYVGDEYIMSTVINCYAHLEQIDLSFGVVAAFIKRGYLPNSYTLSCIIKAYFLQGKVGEAIHLFKNVIRHDLCQVNQYTIATVLNGLSKSGNIAYAVELLRLSQKNNWNLDVVCYNTVMDGLFKGCMLRQGTDLLLEMADRGILPNVVGYTCYIHALCVNGRLGFALATFNGLPSKGISPDVLTYTVMIQGLCRQALFQDAKEMLHKMEQAGCFPDSITYNKIIQGCLHHFDRFDSTNLLNQIVGMDFQLDAQTFYLLLRRIQILRQMPGIYDDDVISHLIRKLILSYGIYQMRDNNDVLTICSLIHKLKCDR